MSEAAMLNALLFLPLRQGLCNSFVALGLLEFAPSTSSRCTNCHFRTLFRPRAFRQDVTHCEVITRHIFRQHSSLSIKKFSTPCRQ